MDSKKIIRELFKIASKQQEIITKLAQGLPVPAANLDADKPELHAADLVLQHLPPGLKSTVKDMQSNADTLNVAFLPGKASQQAVDGITKVVQSLYDSGKLPFAYKVNPIA